MDDIGSIQEQSDSSLTCRYCGRTFIQASALSNHRRFCKPGKDVLQDVLSKSKAVGGAWLDRHAKKKQKLAHHGKTLEVQPAAGLSGVNLPSAPGSSSASGAFIESQQFKTPTVQAESVSTVECSSHVNLDLPLAQRRARRLEKRRPKRYQDILPQPMASLPPVHLLSENSVTCSSDSESPALQVLLSPSMSKPTVQILDSPHNNFCVFRRYEAVDFPLHDPDEDFTLAHFSDVSMASTSNLNNSKLVDLYAPYPNKSSYLLGEWYWKKGQKSHQDFSDLVDVLSDPDFCTEDIKKTRWKVVNEQLGSSDVTQAGDNLELLMAEQDAVWKKEPIVLTVPFHKSTASPGNKTFPAGDFYRRSIVDVLRERIAGADGHHFHYEPYELLWQPHANKKPIRVFGELYASDEFKRVHHDLQNSPPEPNCNLPRIVVGLMFSSDVTHLTQFGDAKLWPVYMFFGNDSKYRRNKPNLGLVNHIAYLQKVCPPQPAIS